MNATLVALLLATTLLTRQWPEDFPLAEQEALRQRIADYVRQGTGRPDPRRDPTPVL
jgi:hypothetical protein